MMTSKSGFAKSLEDEVKKARFSEQQIIEILKLAKAGTKVADRPEGDGRVASQFTSKPTFVWHRLSRSVVSQWALD